MRPPIDYGKCARCLTLDCGREIYNFSGSKGCYGCSCETFIKTDMNHKITDFIICEH